MQAMRQSYNLEANESAVQDLAGDGGGSWGKVKKRSGVMSERSNV
jgi:hypothetical protein